MNNEIFAIAPISFSLKNALQNKLNSLTKPIGSLGVLENLALQIGMIQNSLTPQIIKPYVLVFAGDHGAANDGVSAYPQEVTWQMVQNFMQGGAAINVLSRANGLELRVVDAGVNHEFFPQPYLLNKKVAYGTASFIHGAAMTVDEAQTAVKRGLAVVERIAEDGTNLIVFGEMGIGNTASAALLMHYFTDEPLANCVGRGTGLDDAGMVKKHALLQQALQHGRDVKTPLEALAQYGGFEIAMMVGAMLAAARQRCVIVVDGFISTAALLVAHALQPNVLQYAVFAHTSGEQGHATMLQFLQATPLLNLQMRLGEGTGGALAVPIIEAALKLLNQMATFDSATVSQAVEAAE